MKRRRITAGTHCPLPPRNCQWRTHAPCRLVAVFILASWAELRATHSRPAERLGLRWRITGLGRLLRVVWQHHSAGSRRSVGCSSVGLLRITWPLTALARVEHRYLRRRIRKQSWAVAASPRRPELRAGRVSCLHHWDVICWAKPLEAHLTGPGSEPTWRQSPS